MLFERFRRGDISELLAELPSPVGHARRRQRRLTPDDVDQLVRDYCDGLGSIYLAASYGVHRNTIAKHLKERGLELGRLSLSDAEIKRARELRGEGLSLNAIGRAIGRDPKTVKQALS